MRQACPRADLAEAGPISAPRALPGRIGREPLSTSDDALLAFMDGLAPGARLFGIDLGTKTIGIAMSDVERSLATPLETIRRVKFTPDVEKLRALAQRFGVGGLVMGLPLNMDGTEGPRSQATRAFVRNMKPLLPLPVLFWDERLTTVAANRMLIEADTSRARRAELVDRVAASYILQGALDRYHRLLPEEDEDFER